MSYFSRRLLSVIPLLLVVTLLCFSMLKLLPGDPVLTILGNSSTDPVKVEALTKKLGLDRPFPVQYAKWAGNFVTGDFGRTYNQGGGEPVRNAVTRAAPVTFELVSSPCCWGQVSRSCSVPSGGIDQVPSSTG